MEWMGDFVVQAFKAFPQCKEYLRRPNVWNAWYAQIGPCTAILVQHLTQDEAWAIAFRGPIASHKPQQTWDSVSVQTKEDFANWFALMFQFWDLKLRALELEWQECRDAIHLDIHEIKHTNLRVFRRNSPRTHWEIGFGSTPYEAYTNALNIHFDCQGDAFRYAEAWRRTIFDWEYKPGRDLYFSTPNTTNVSCEIPFENGLWQGVYPTEDPLTAIRAFEQAFYNDG